MALASFGIEHLLILPIALAAFLLLLTIIVFFHEYGHFAMARALGIRVEIFSIGFGKPLARWRDRKGTEWRIAVLPFGGYVKFFGDAGPASNPGKKVETARDEAHPATTQFPRVGREDETPSGMTEEERAVCFHFKPVWVRTLVVAAGPIANFALAFVIFWALLMGLGAVVGEPRVGAVVEDSAAAEAGFEAGDVVLSVDGRPIDSFDDLQRAIRLSTGETLVFDVERAGETIKLAATPRRQAIEDAFGNEVEVGMLGLNGDPEAFSLVRYGPVVALGEAARQVGHVIASTGRFLGRLVLGKESVKQLGGPIKMAQYAGQSALSGFDEEGYREPPSFLTRLKVSLANFINLAAIVSVSIGFLNLLPIPVLDGGHLVYYAYEAAVGRPLSIKAQAIGFRLGIVILASFMLLVTWNDISNLFVSS